MRVTETICWPYKTRFPSSYKNGSKKRRLKRGTPTRAYETADLRGKLQSLRFSGSTSRSLGLLVTIKSDINGDNPALNSLTSKGGTPAGSSIHLTKEPRIFRALPL